jgi:enterochelin esterase-like enzyme
MTSPDAAGKPTTVAGDLRLHDFKSVRLGGTRRVAVWLPPGYGADDVRRFPVLYLHDGQNLFDNATAFGEEWQVDETATALIEAREIQPLIVVGIYNGGNKRIEEYTTAVDTLRWWRRMSVRGKHGPMLAEELKPWIDKTYRTLPDASNTAIGGSSMGGLASLRVALRYYRIFGKAAVMSPSVWWNDRELLWEVEALPDTGGGPLPVRIWLDAGTAEAPSVIPDVRALRDALERKGWRPGTDLAYMEADGAGHDERAWAARVAPMLRFLFPPPPPSSE